MIRIFVRITYHKVWNKFSQKKKNKKKKTNKKNKQTKKQQQKVVQTLRPWSVLQVNVTYVFIRVKSTDTNQKATGFTELL